MSERELNGAIAIAPAAWGGEMLKMMLRSWEEALDEACVFCLVHRSHSTQKDLWFKGAMTNQRGWSWVEWVCRTLSFLRVFC